jgi:hypothetical protein
LFILDCLCVLCTQCCHYLWIVHSWLPGQSRMNNPEIMATLGTQDTGAIKNEQSRDNGNIGYTRHRGNQEWTIVLPKYALVSLTDNPPYTKISS